MKSLPILMLLVASGAALAQPQPPAAAPSGRAESPRQATPAQAAMPLSPGTQVITLEQAERLLVERNLAVIAARRGVDSARAQRLVASSLPPAVVSAGNTFGQFNEGGRPAAGSPNTANITGARFLGPQNNVTVGLQVLVELGGKRTLRTRLAEENIGAAEAQVLDALRSQLYVLRQNFFTALGARANLEVALANRAGLDRTEALLRRQLRDGAIPEGDLLRFQASRVVFENDVVTNAQAYAAAVAQIAVTLAADAADFRPGEPPAVPTRRGATSSDPVRATLSAIAFDVQGRFNTIPDLGIGREELGAAVQDRPDVVAALRQASAAGANLALVEATRWRDVTVNAGFARTRLNQNVPSGTIPLLANDQFSMQLSVPIFTRRIVEGNVGVAAGQAGQADALARAALLQARADFAIAWSAVEQSRNLLRVYTGGALGRAEAAYRSAEQAYTAGGSSLLEVLDALRTLNATRLAANLARTNYLVALAQLEQATGVSGVSPRL
ncbi:TolC family protein [Rhodovarius sp.]|uniref:TolC family protein n=1 Tax=Rhodovarius sp. TaxID=2972673 RepID=UPI00334185DF